MTKRSIKFGFNHMVSPSLTPDELVDAAVKLGAVAIELRNDVGENRLKDVETARRVGAKASDAGLEVRSINALYPFNVWNEERGRQTETLARLAAACGAIGLVMCPLNEGKMLEDTPEKAAGLRAALSGIRPILEDHGLKGFVEPLGFPVSSLRFKREALTAIDNIDGAEVFTLVHDTFHHRGAKSSSFSPAVPTSCTFPGWKIPASASRTCWMAIACSSARRIASAISSNSDSSMPMAMTALFRLNPSPRRSTACPIRSRRYETAWLMCGKRWREPRLFDAFRRRGSRLPPVQRGW